MRQRFVNQIFFRPSNEYIPCRKDEVLLQTDSGQVQLWREYSGRTAGAWRDARLHVVRFLGSRGRAEMATLDPVDRLPNVDAAVWTLNPPAFGATSGPPDLDRYVRCAIAALEHVSSVANGRPVWVCGKSIGTAAALAATAQVATTALILRNAMPLQSLLNEHYARRTLGASRLLISPAIPPGLDSIANARRCSVPALFLVSREDRVVPPAYQHRVIAAYGGSSTVIEVAGGHDDRTLRIDDERRYSEGLGALALSANL